MSAPVTVIFVCSNCCAGYQATQSGRRLRRPAVASNVRFAILKFISVSSYAYVDWAAVETIPKPRRVARPNGKFR